MKIEQLYTGCLAQGAYYIESDGEVAIIDPLREVQPYIDQASEANASIKYIFETHFHADFVSGHITLSKKTNAPIIYGPNANPNFDCIIAEDGQVFSLGKITITALHTPGHTMESTTYLVKDETGKDYAIFSGDTLFLGDVGRPDLAQKGAEITAEDLAKTLFNSLRNKIMPLADDVIVYPAHGAGSACGKNMMKETVDTLGNQKKVNYALRVDMTEDEFVTEVLDGLVAPPDYFPLNVKLNKEGYEDIDDVIHRANKPLSVEEFKALANSTGALVLDVRHQDEYCLGHIPRSIFIGIHSGFAPWAGALIADIQQPILLVTPIGKEEETITRLSRVGFDNTLGFLAGGYEAWKESGNKFDTIDSIEAKDTKVATATFDVRKPTEFEQGSIKGAYNSPLSEINKHLEKFPNEGIFQIHCAGGYRSIIAGSILKSRGIHNFVNILGGYNEIKKFQI